MGQHYVICPICGVRFNRDKTPCIPVKNRYVHVECAKNKEERMSQEQKDKKDLEEYIMKLFGTDYVEPKVQKQIKRYIEENKYTYSGIKKALVYHYEIKHGDINKAHGGIGIVEYVYRDAYNYYYSIWEAQQENRIKPPELLQKPKDIIVKISIPKRPFKRGRFFRFLDDEEDD